MLLTEAVRSHLGEQVHYVAPTPVGEASIRYFALAIGADPEVVSPTLACETNQFAHRSVPDADGYQGHSWQLDLPVPCRMIRGGNDYRLGRRLRPDDVVETVWELTDMIERSSASGPMLLVTAEGTYTAAGEWLATNTETLIYLPVEGAV